MPPLNIKGAPPKKGATAFKKAQVLTDKSVEATIDMIKGSEKEKRLTEAEREALKNTRTRAAKRSWKTSKINNGGGRVSEPRWDVLDGADPWASSGQSHATSGSF